MQTRRQFIKRSSETALGFGTGLAVLTVPGCNPLPSGYTESGVKNWIQNNCVCVSQFEVYPTDDGEGTDQVLACYTPPPSDLKSWLATYLSARYNAPSINATFCGPCVDFPRASSGMPACDASGKAIDPDAD